MSMVKAIIQNSLPPEVYEIVRGPELKQILETYIHFDVQMDEQDMTQVCEAALIYEPKDYDLIGGIMIKIPFQHDLFVMAVMVGVPCDILTTWCLKITSRVFLRTALKLSAFDRDNYVQVCDLTKATPDLISLIQARSIRIEGYKYYSDEAFPLSLKGKDPIYYFPCYKQRRMPKTLMVNLHNAFLKKCDLGKSDEVHVQLGRRWAAKLFSTMPLEELQKVLHYERYSAWLLVGLDVLERRLNSDPAGRRLSRIIASELHQLASNFNLKDHERRLVYLRVHTCLKLEDSEAGVNEIQLEHIRQLILQARLDVMRAQSNPHESA